MTNKPLNRKNYGTIAHLSNSKLGKGDHIIDIGQERILTLKTRDSKDTIFVFEKYDGSNVGICKVNNTIYPITRAGYKANTSRWLQHKMFNDYVYKNISLWMEILEEGERITGEWMAQVHGLKYNINIKDPIVFFDMFDSNNKRLPYKTFKKRIGNLFSARLLHEGNAILVKDVVDILNNKTPEIESLEVPEGMVYRVEREGQVDFLAKWVRSDYEPGKYMKDEIFNIKI